MLKILLLKFLHTFFLLVLYAQVLLAQTHIYQHFSIDEGLPSSEVYDIYQDKLGYVWFATDKGLSRYNGYEFENFTTQDGLTGNTILDFNLLDNDQIWCYDYHNQMLFYFNSVFNGFKPYKYNALLKSQLDGNSIIKSLFIDKNGTLHIGGYGFCGVIRITSTGLLTREFDTDPRANNGYKFSSIKAAVDLKSKVFFSSCGDFTDEKAVFTVPNTYSNTSRMDIINLNTSESIFIDRKLGLFTNGEVRYLNLKKNPTGIKRVNDSLFFVGYYGSGAEIRNIEGTYSQSFLENKSVSNFLKDKEGGYWFSTLDDGVFYIKTPDIKIFCRDHIVSLVKDNNNKLFAGYSNGTVAEISTQGNNILFKGNNTNKAIVAFDKKNKHLYGYTNYNLINYTSSKSVFNSFSNNLPEDISNPLLTSSANGFHMYENNVLKSYHVDAKIQDIAYFKNSVFIGTSTGLYIMDQDSLYPYTGKHIPKLRIDDIDVNNNTAYLATQGAGIIVHGDTSFRITKKDGLTNDIVSEIHIENDSVLWACTNTGLNKINFNNGNTFTITTITKADGLLSNDIDDVEIINDTVWVATKSGLCYFNKAVLAEKEMLNIQSLSLKKVMVNNKLIVDKNITLAHNENSIDFVLQAISTKNTGDINYFYRLKEVDSTWAKTKNRTVSFPSLSPGTYTFEARAKVLNNPNLFITTYNFKILPPFWKSWWFYSLCTLVFFALIILFFKIRVLTYNKDVFRELIRLAIKRLKRKELFYKFRANGEDFKIPTHDILYINSQGNYLDIVTKKRTYTIRCKIADFIAATPDPLEYLRLHRSYIVRIEQVTSKGKNWVVVKDEKIPVGETYLEQLNNIQF